MAKMDKNQNKEKNTSLTYKIESFASRYKIPLGAALIAVAVILPQLAPSDYFVRIMSNMCLYSALALALNILTGEMGLMSLGQAGFVGVGAYTGALLATKLNAPFIVCFICAGLLSGLFGLLLGIPTLRLEGPYLAIVTIGFGEIMRMIFLNWTPVTGGAIGIKNIPRPKLFGISMTYTNRGFYYVAFVWMLIVLAFVWSYKKSKFGRGMLAIKDDPLAARLMGVPVTGYKVLGFFLASVMTGCCGYIYATGQMYIDSNSFLGEMSILIVTCLVVGGMGTLRGPILGAILMILLPEALRFLQDYRFIIYGILLVVMMRVRPQGLLGWKSPLPYKMPKQPGKE